MSLSTGIADVQSYVRSQLIRHLGMLHELEASETSQIDSLLPKTFRDTEYCWSQISNKYYNRDGIPTLNINNSNQYCQFLLMFARQASSHGASVLADKIFGLNKMLNSCDIYHEVILPKSFYIDHTIGVVVGRAKLGERLFLSQNCTIGSNPGSSNYPDLGSNNFLMSNTTIIGSVKTGDRVIFSTGSYVKDIEIPSDSVVFGRAPNHVVKPLKAESFKKASPFIA